MQKMSRSTELLAGPAAVRGTAAEISELGRLDEIALGVGVDKRERATVNGLCRARHGPVTDQILPATVKPQVEGSHSGLVRRS